MATFKEKLKFTGK